jgi:hypothetical protein
LAVTVFCIKFVGSITAHWAWAGANTPIPAANARVDATFAIKAVLRRVFMIPSLALMIEVAIVSALGKNSLKFRMAISPPVC